MIERRKNVRRATIRKMLVSAIYSGQRSIGQIVNITGYGAAIKLQNPLGLNKNDRFELTFVISYGNVSKLHFKMATVIHVTNGIIGVIIGPK